jgi:hypothetical protein
MPATVMGAELWMYAGRMGTRLPLSSIAPSWMIGRAGTTVVGNTITSTFCARK